MGARDIVVPVNFQFTFFNGEYQVELVLFERVEEVDAVAIVFVAEYGGVGSTFGVVGKRLGPEFVFFEYCGSGGITF